MGENTGEGNFEDETKKSFQRVVFLFLTVRNEAAALSDGSFLISALARARSECESRAENEWCWLFVTVCCRLWCRLCSEVGSAWFEASDAKEISPRQYCQDISELIKLLRN
jgi:hypothetical protein